MNTRRAIPVTTQWVLWGEDLRGGYGVLAHSAGAFDRKSVDEITRRCSLGTSNSRPQVTIGWMYDTAANDALIAIAASSFVVATSVFHLIQL